MKKKFILFALMTLLALFVFNTCSKINPLPDIAQPVVKRSVEKDTVVVGDTTIVTGPLRDYEQDSKVIFKLTVTSTSNLKKLFVTTTSDAVSSLSRVLRSEPADAVDASGNFIKNLKNVVVYYAFHIHPAVPILSSQSVTFSFQNEKDYIGITTQIFTVIKIGSTNGKPLTVIKMPWAGKQKGGIGAQPGLENQTGWRSGNQLSTYRGPFYSVEHHIDIWKKDDAISSAADIDIVGNIPQTNRTNDPGIIALGWYLVSPSDTTLLTNTYAGALIARVRLTGGAAGEKVNISVGGITRTATFATNTTVTATNFVTANKAAYTAIGIDLTASGAILTFLAINDGVGFGFPSSVLTVANGGMYGNEDLSGIPGYFTLQYARNPPGLACIILMRQTIREMAKKLGSEGKSLRKTMFKRLDNSTGPDKISINDVDLLTHDNEFDVLLGDVVAHGKTYGGPVALEQVWGFVMDDGRRGLIRTSNIKDYADQLKNGTSAALETVTPPSSNPWNLWCTIKVQENK